MYLKQNSTIAVIDSGVGGVSILKQLIEKFGYGNYIYYADNLYMPYGNKSKPFIKKRVENIIDMLIQKYGVSCVIVACNTASSSIETKKYKNVLIMSFDDALTYLATPLTKSNLPKLNVIANNNLAKLVEKYIVNNSKKLSKVVEEHIDKYELYKLSSLCLGCTHYELVVDYFNKFLPNTKVIKNSSKVIENIILEPSKELNVVFLCSRYSKKYIEKLRKIALN